MSLNSFLCTLFIGVLIFLPFREDYLAEPEPAEICRFLVIHLSSKAMLSMYRMYFEDSRLVFDGANCCVGP